MQNSCNKTFKTAIIQFFVSLVVTKTFIFFWLPKSYRKIFVITKTPFEKTKVLNYFSFISNIKFWVENGFS